MATVAAPTAAEELIDISLIAGNLEKVVADVADAVAEVADEVAEVKAEAEEDAPLDLADLQNKRLGYAAEGLGLEGVMDIDDLIASI